MNTLATNLEELNIHLKAQATANATLVLDDTVFSTVVLDAIRSALALAKGANLTIIGVNPTDIPEPSNGILSISAGTTSALNQSSLSVSLSFTAPGNSIEGIILLTMSTSWKFKDSFEGLNLFPFQNIETSKANFVYSTIKQQGYPWPNNPDDKIDLDAGLNFLSEATISNYSLLSALLGAPLNTKPLKFFGPFSLVEGQQLPIGTIKFPLGSGILEVGTAPNSLSLNAPEVAVRLAPSSEDEPLQSIQLIIAANYNNALNVAVELPMVGSTLAISAKPLPGSNSINSLIESLPGGSGFTNLIPRELSPIFDNVGLENFTMIVNGNRKVTFISLSISTLKTWSIISEVLVLEGLGLQIEITDPSGINWQRVFIKAQAKFLPEIFTGNFDFIVGLQKQASWEVSTVSGAYYGSVNLGDIVDGLQGSVPDALRTIAFSNFGISANRISQGAPFAYSFYGSIETSFPILGSKLLAYLNLAVAKTETSHTINLGGSLIIDSQAFALKLDLGTLNSKLTASWEAQNEAYIKFADIASAFGLEVPEIPEDLDLSLKSADLTYDFSKEILVLKAVSVNYGNAVFVAFKNTAATPPKWQFYFGLNVGKPINLSDLPLVNKALPADKKIEVKNLQVLIASTPLDPRKQEDVNAITYINILIGVSKGFPTIPPQGFPSTLALSALLDFGGFVIPLSTGTPNNTAPQSGPSTPALPFAGNGTGTNTAPIPPPTQTADGTTWFDLQQNFGPVNFQKVGVKYQDGKLWFLLNASLGLGGLELSMIGLSVASPLNNFDPIFSLQGLGLDYKQGPIEIGGSFLRTLVTTAENGTTLAPDKQYNEYAGMAVLKLKTLNISAIGSYAQVNGEHSLFIYAALNYPLGGPAFFFVTGLAAGFGYNRALRMPDITKVDTFPLITAAIGGKAPQGGEAERRSYLQTALQSLQRDIYPKSGEYFLAVGIRYTSFEMIDSFALLNVSFGQHLEIDLLGLSTMALPTADPNATPTVSPLVEVQMALKAVINPDEGFVGVEGQLTNKSYLFARACHLTGGFAFYTWFDGPHKGDFVVSLGGYHPAFVRPRHYPIVPRLGINWVISDTVSIKGEAYFALTAHALMAGGRLEALFHEGGLKAWFIIGADFIISWKPYFYDARMYLDMGVSYTFQLCGTQTISVNVGADLHIWGPDFSGIATIHLWIISFDVAFGNAAPKPRPIDWETFKSSFLPKDPKGALKGVLSVTASDGLVREETTADGKKRTVLDPKNAALMVNSMIPVKAYDLGLSVTDKLYYADADHRILLSIRKEMLTKNPMTTSDFGIAPMGVASVDKSNMKITLQREGVDINADFAFTPVLKRMPRAMWGNQLTAEANGAQFIENALAGFEIRPAKPATPSETHAVPKETLKYDIEAIKKAFSSPSIESYSGSGNADFTNISDQKTTSQREAMLTSLGFNVSELELVIPTNLDQIFVKQPRKGTFA